MASLDFLKTKNTASDDAQWISLSDLMTSLMLVFMLLAVSFMVKIEIDNKKIKEIAKNYSHNKSLLYQDLSKEFKQDLKKWGATLTPDLTLRFNEPEVLFQTGSDRLKDKFKGILSDFFPRYINVITKKKYKSTIKEIRIEGHTSTIWNYKTKADDAYFYNMELSQSRTRSALRYVMELPVLRNKLIWLKRHATANGLSSSQPILDKNGHEDLNASQRVEFRVITNSEEKIAEILKVQ